MLFTEFPMILTVVTSSTTMQQHKHGMENLGGKKKRQHQKNDPLVVLKWVTVDTCIEIVQVKASQKKHQQKLHQWKPHQIYKPSIYLKNSNKVIQTSICHFS